MNPIIPFISETDPKNPYGVNFEGWDKKIKIEYKFNEVKKYVHFSDEDRDHFTKMSSIHYLNCFSSVFLPLALIKGGFYFIEKLSKN